MLHQKVSVNRLCSAPEEFIHYAVDGHPEDDPAQLYPSSMDSYGVPPRPDIGYISTDCIYNDLYHDLVSFS